MNEAFSITREIDAFAKYLAEEEKSGVTIAKYVRDVQCFLRWLGGSRESGRSPTSDICSRAATRCGP